MKDILTLFINTFEDQRLSDDERKVLVNLLEQKELFIQDIGYLRNRLFDFAKQALNTATPIAVLNWMEKINKILARFEREAIKKEIKSHVLFNPGNDCRSAIRSFIQKAKKSLDICVFTISDDRIAKDILKVHNQGVKVRLITDNVTVDNKGSGIKRFFKAGITVKTDLSESFMQS